MYANACSPRPPRGLLFVEERPVLWDKSLKVSMRSIVTETKLGEKLHFHPVLYTLLPSVYRILKNRHCFIVSARVDSEWGLLMLSVKRYPVGRRRDFQGECSVSGYVLQSVSVHNGVCCFMPAFWCLRRRWNWSKWLHGVRTSTRTLVHYCTKTINDQVTPRVSPC